MQAGVDPVVLALLVVTPHSVSLSLHFGFGSLLCVLRCVKSVLRVNDIVVHRPSIHQYRMQQLRG